MLTSRRFAVAASDAPIPPVSATSIRMTWARDVRPSAMMVMPMTCQHDRSQEGRLQEELPTVDCDRAGENASEEHRSAVGEKADPHAADSPTHPRVAVPDRLEPLRSQMGQVSGDSLHVRDQNVSEARDVRRRRLRSERQGQQSKPEAPGLTAHRPQRDAEAIAFIKQRNEIASHACTRREGITQQTVFRHDVHASVELRMPNLHFAADAQCDEQPVKSTLRLDAEVESAHSLDSDAQLECDLAPVPNVPLVSNAVGLAGFAPPSCLDAMPVCDDHSD